MSDNSSASGGLGICSVLTIVFVVLKLTGHVDWSWFWVLSPSIFSIGFLLLLLILVIPLVWFKD